LISRIMALKIAIEILTRMKERNYESLDEINSLRVLFTDCNTGYGRTPD